MHRLADRRRLVLDATTPLLDAAVALLSRGGSGADEELLVRWSDGNLGTAPIAELYRSVAGMLDERMRTVTTEHDLLNAVVRSTTDAIGVLDIDGNIRMANPAMCKLVGDRGERIGDRWPDAERRVIRRALLDAAESPATAVAVDIRAAVDGAERSLRVVLTDLRRDPHVAGVVVNASDRTALEAMRRRLEHEASHDPLTDLPNRSALPDAFARVRSRGTGGIALLYVDVDRFKSVNDSLGHRAGDELLIAVAHRLQVCVREPDELLRDADAAMYDAKVRGGSQWALFDEEARRTRERRATLERRLARAVAADEIAVVYQPIVDLRSFDVVGVEALARWYPASGEVRPDEFIPLAEETGLIHALGRAVLGRACREIAALNAALGVARPLDLSVNLSGRQLGRPGIAEELLSTMRRSGLDPRAVTLELTESSLLLDAAGAAVVLDTLSKVGVRLALDDFGTGYSSLAHLHRYRFDRLKIDRTFVAQLGSARSGTIAASIVALGASLGIEVVAEGIEEDEQLASLRSLGCRIGQGWRFSPALPIDALGELLRRGGGHRAAAWDGAGASEPG